MGSQEVTDLVIFWQRSHHPERGSSDAFLMVLPERLNGSASSQGASKTGWTSCQVHPTERRLRKTRCGVLIHLICWIPHCATCGSSPELEASESQHWRVWETQSVRDLTQALRRLGPPRFYDHRKWAESVTTCSSSGRTLRVAQQTQESHSEHREESQHIWEAQEPKWERPAFSDYAGHRGLLARNLWLPEHKGHA